MKKFRILFALVALVLILATCLTSCEYLDDIIDIAKDLEQGLEDFKEILSELENIELNVPDDSTVDPEQNVNIPSVGLDCIPEFSDVPYVKINDDIPFFTPDEIVSESYELYYEQDKLGRCTLTIACIGPDLMPTDDRGSIGQVKPSGWQSVKYDIVDGKYLYNRCHLIGFQLTGENANVNNLITGTRYLNVIGMLPFEDMVADYIKETENHVMYRVTPIYEGDELVARGVLMEGWSVEDNGEGICFCIYAYNNQPGVIINYADGTSALDPNYEPTKN